METRRRSSSFSSAARASLLQWEKVQVELHGEFPPDHIKHFEEYVAQTSWWRALLVCLWTPVPVMLVTAAIEWSPLEDLATHSASQSPRFWLRCFIVLVICSLCYMEQFRQHVPSLMLSRRIMLPVALAGSGVASVVIFLLADLVAYPFPFLTNVASMAAAPTLVFLLWFAIRDQLDTKPRLRADLRRHLVVCACQIVMITIYPIYNTLFARASSWGQTAMVFILPLIKLLIMNCISRWIANTDEARPESVIFNVEVFHALYVSFSMQNSTAIHTMVAIMAVDFLHAWLSFRDIHRVSETMRPAIDSVLASNRSLVDFASRVATENQPASASQRKEASYSESTKVHALLTPARVQPSAWVDERKEKEAPAKDFDPLVSDVQELTIKQRAKFLQQTQKLLFMTEFVALIEYTEVLMPCIFNMSIFAMYHLPNRQYYSFLRDLTSPQLTRQISYVFLYALLELGSVVVMGIILWRKLRLSLLHQIAFVLETRQASIQSKVIMWALNVLQNQVQHTGVDYSFRFAWLESIPKSG